MKVMHLRPGMLLARWWPGRACPALLMTGFLCWLGMIGCHALGDLLLPAIALGLIGLGAMICGPLIALQTIWMCVDLERGWIHWRHRVRCDDTVESFSVDRLDHLRLVRRGARFGPGWYEMVLQLDHPRLKRLALGWWLRRGTAEAVTRRTAAALNVCWLDDRQLLHVARPACEFEFEGAGNAPGAGAAPPEIDVQATRGGRLILLPNFAGWAHGDGMFFCYAMVWNLWSWSCLVYEGIHFGPVSLWTPEQLMAIGILSGAGLAGLVMLHAALLRVMGRQGLRWNGENWQLTRTWLGACWGWQSIEMRPGTWLRRIDPPGQEAGLWVSTSGPEVRLGHELSSEGLAWLHRMLLWPEMLREEN